MNAPPRHELYVLDDGEKQYVSLAIPSPSIYLTRPPLASKSQKTLKSPTRLPSKS
jgi:hypothetical protein